MQIRASRISASIARAISRQYHDQNTASGTVVQSFVAFFAFFKLLLTRYRPADFLTLRHETWQLDEDEYLDSFHDSEDAAASSHGIRDRRKAKGKDIEGTDHELVPVGDLGYSGSTFFTTANGKFLIKSLPRRFEHQFFTHDLFAPYVEHMRTHSESLLVRITDMVYTPYPTLGGILGTAPTHHIVMENLLFGKEEDEKERQREGEEEGNAERSEEIPRKWETYDLKPSSYFFPERDIADGKLAPDSVLDKLIDEFPDKIRVSGDLRSSLLSTLESDTALLASNNAIDYSLFLVRYPCPSTRPSTSPFTDPIPSVVGGAESSPWRTGVDDTDGKWTYRAVVLDFFWAKHKFEAKAMTGLIDTFNLVAKKGPMSITAEPGEYRERFLKMVREMVVEQR